MKQFEVYDKVWVIKYNKIVELMVYSKREYMNIGKTGVDLAYTLVTGTCGAGVSPNEELHYHPGDIYETKEQLINTL